MTTIFLADGFLLLEIEGDLDRFEPLNEPDHRGLFDTDETEPCPRETDHWGYRDPALGVRYYFFE